VLALADAIAEPHAPAVDTAGGSAAVPPVGKLGALTVVRALERDLAGRLAVLDRKRAECETLLEGRALAHILHAAGYLAPFAACSLSPKRLGPADTILPRQRRMIAQSSADSHCILKPCQPVVLTAIDRDYLVECLHDCSMAFLPPELWGRLRVSDANLRPVQHQQKVSLHDDSQGGVLPDAVSAALAQHCAMFDWRDWEQVHPLVRTAMGFADFLRIKPFAAANRMLAEVLFELRLSENGFSLFPVAGPLHWHRKELTVALANKDPDARLAHTVSLLTDICVEGLELGIRLAQTVMNLRKQLCAVLFPDRGPARADELFVGAMLGCGIFRADDLVHKRDQWPALERLLQPAARLGLLRPAGDSRKRAWLIPSLLAALRPPRSGR